MFNPINDHVDEAIDRLLFEYKSADGIHSLIYAFVSPLQTIEGVLSDLNNFRALNTAEGQQLDNIGEIIGIARRPGQNDAQYLLSLYGQIGVNNSVGIADNIIAAFLSYTGATDCNVYEFFPAQCYIVSSYVFPSMQAYNDAKAFMQTVVGVSVYFSGFQNNPPVVNFAFEGYQVGNLGAGFGDLNDPSVGGFWSSELDPTIPT